NGVSTYLALIFGTLLSSQGTDTSFVLTHRTFSGAFLRAFPFGVSQSYQIRFPFGIRFRWPIGRPSLIRLPYGSLSASPTLSEVFDRPDRPLVPE
ncbi:hypothetical protein, partial [Streptomyces sp. 2A115]|uniref:hypothetical protein n=1 Tax=Streptomyces sp. 2A115 TaxID=3457439 RepID=UPI003FD2DB3F